VRLGRVAYDCERDLRLIRMESAQSREISPQELLEKPAAQGGVRQRGQAPVHGVGHPGVEKVVLLSGDQPLACVEGPRLQAVSD